MKIDLTQDQLKQVIKYDAETGAFSWVTQRGRNARAGEQAGTISTQGYRYIKINGYSYRHLVWRGSTCTASGLRS